MSARSAQLLAGAVLGITGCAPTSEGGVSRWELDRRDKSLAETLEKYRELNEQTVKALTIAKETDDLIFARLEQLEGRVKALESGTFPERVRDAKASDLSVEDASFRFIETDGANWTISWRARVRNKIDARVSFSLYAQFKDGRGFEVTKAVASDEIESFHVDDVTGSTMVTADEGRQIQSVSAKATVTR